MELHIAPCTDQDLEVLVNLSKHTFIDAFEDDNDPENFEAYISTAFDKEVLRNQLLDPNTQFYFVYLDAVVVGYFKLNERGSQTDMKDDNALEIERIYVLKDYQGKGIGAWMMKRIISMAGDKKKYYLWLGVWEKNPKAIKFYQGLGFYRFGSHPYYIGRDKQQDWLMRLDL